MSAGPLPPVSELVPHQPPMLLVDELLEYAEGRARVRARIKPNNVLAAAGRVPATILLEVMAQAAAVAIGMHERSLGRAPITGMLLGTRELELAVDELMIGDVLVIDVRRTYEQAKLAAWACVVTGADSETPLARAELNLWADTP